MLRGMTVRARHLLSLFLAAGLVACASAQADSLASSASSAGSASSGSVSDSFHGSSRSSSGDEKRADVDYQVLDVGVVPERDGVARLALRARNSAEVVYLDLPRDIPARHHIVAGIWCMRSMRCTASRSRGPTSASPSISFSRTTGTMVSRPAR